MDISRYFRTGACAAVTVNVEDITGSPPTSFTGFLRDHAHALGPE